MLVLCVLASAYPFPPSLVRYFCLRKKTYEVNKANDRSVRLVEGLDRFRVKIIIFNLIKKSLITVKSNLIAEEAIRANDELGVVKDDLHVASDQNETTKTKTT